MEIKPLFISCLILTCMFASHVSAFRITSLEVSKDPVDYGEKFTITAKFSGVDDTYIVNCYVDEYKLTPKNLGAGIEEVEFKLEKNAGDWEDAGIRCGLRDARIEILTTSTQTKVMEETVKFNIGHVPNIEFIPTQPIPNRVVRVKIVDSENGNPLPNVNVEMKDVYGGDVITQKTTSDGTFTFTPTVAGEYNMKLKEKDICGDVKFYIKRPLIVDGPYPENPVVKEMIRMAVPAGSGVGLKVFDSNGNTYKTVAAAYNGGANFTIEDPGTYTLAIGEISTKYWNLNKTITVSDRLTPEIKIAPEQPTVGQPVTITILSRGDALPSSTVTIKKPDGVENDYTTSSFGTMTYETVSSIGVFEVRASKDRYASSTTSFEAKNSFSIKLEPETPTVKDTLTITVNDQSQKPVPDVLVEVLETDTKKTTDLAGKATFNLQEPGKYTFKLSKDMFWDKILEINPFGMLSTDPIPAEVELGKDITVKVYDSFEAPTNAEITIKDSIGKVRQYTASEQSITTERPGIHILTVSKSNYVGTNQTFKVKAYPLDVLTRMDSGILHINITREGEPIEGLKTVLDNKGELTESTTNEQGLASFALNEEGNVTVTVNKGEGSIMYEEKTLDLGIVRSYDLILLTTPLVIIFLITMMTLIAVYLGRKYLGDVSMPQIRKMKTQPKHSSQLMGSKKPGRSRLSGR